MASNVQVDISAVDAKKRAELQPAWEALLALRAEAAFAEEASAVQHEQAMEAREIPLSSAPSKEPEEAAGQSESGYADADQPDPSLQ